MIITAVSGVVLIAMGVLLLTGELTRLNIEAQQALDSLGLNLFGGAADSGHATVRRAGCIAPHADPEQAERPRDHALRRDAEGEPERLERLRLGADDAAVAVERGERLRGLERVGGDPVRRAPLGRLGDLGREREQLLDQLALGRLEREPLARRAPSAAATRSSPALRSTEAIRACAYCT